MSGDGTPRSSKYLNDGGIDLAPGPPGLLKRGICRSSPSAEHSVRCVMGGFPLFFLPLPPCLTGPMGFCCSWTTGTGIFVGSGTRVGAGAVEWRRLD